MTPTHELIVLKAKQRIRRVEEFRMENYFHSIVYAVEKIAATNSVNKQKEFRLRRRNYAIARRYQRVYWQHVLKIAHRSIDEISFVGLLASDPDEGQRDNAKRSAISDKP